MYSTYSTRNRDISTEKRFRMLFVLLRLAGIPICMEKIPKLYYVYSVTAIISGYTMYIGSFLDVFVNEHELKELMSAVRVWSAVSPAIILHALMSIRRSKIETLIFFTESFIWEDLPAKDPNTGYLTQAGLITRNEIIMKYAAVMLISFYYIQSSFRVIRSHDTIFKVWYPFDIYSSPAYEICLVSQVLATIVCAVGIIGFTLLYSSTVYIACSQLEKLGRKITGTKWTVIATRDQSSRSEKNEISYDKRDSHDQETIHHKQIGLKEYINFHQLILEYMEMLEDTLHLLLGGLLLSNLGASCLCAFSIVMNWGDFVDISQGVAAYAGLSAFLYIICNTGTELNNEAQKIREAAWDCDWIGAPIQFQRCVMFIIARANKDFTLTAAKFVPVSMVTFMNMMQQTVSYFMFLLEMKDRNMKTVDINYDYEK